MRGRTITLIIAAAVVVIAGVLLFSGIFRRTPATRIAQKTLYTAPASFPEAAEDWPRWRGPRGDGISRESALAESWPADGPPRLWSAEVGLGYSSPIAAAGRIYLFSLNSGRDALTCFDAHSGQILWNSEESEGWTGNYPGTRSTPAIDDGSIYTYGGGGDLICRDLETGSPRWHINILQETGARNLSWGVSSSPLVAGDLVYVQSGQGGPIAIAVHKETGAVAWKSEAAGIGGYAHPMIIDVEGIPQMIIFGGEAVIAMDPATGRTIWSHPWKTSYDVNAATPVCADGHLFVTSAYDHGCMMLRISADSASKLWESDAVTARFQPPILDGDALFVNSEGTIKCLSWPDGALKWRATDSRLRVGIGGSMVRLEDKLLLMTDRGKLSLARANADGIDLLQQAQVLDAREVWSTPLIYGGRLYAKGGQELVCFDLSSAESSADSNTSRTGT